MGNHLTISTLPTKPLQRPKQLQTYQTFARLEMGKQEEGASREDASQDAFWVGRPESRPKTVWIFVLIFSVQNSRDFSVSFYHNKFH